MQILLLFFVYLVHELEACLALGGCGWGGCLPTLSFGCGRFCRMARGSKTLSAEELKDQVIEDPETMFMKCCQESSLPPQCLEKCSFRTYTKESLHAMFFKQDACPIDAAADIHRCAAQLTDHRQCCLRQGVHTTVAGMKCELFCDQRPTPNVTHLDLTYLPCMERFEQIKSCFWNSAQEQWITYVRTKETEELQNQNQEFETFESSPPKAAGVQMAEKNSEDDSDEDINEQMGSLNSEEKKRYMSTADSEEEELEKRMTEGMTRIGLDDDQEEETTGVNDSGRETIPPSPILRDPQTSWEPQVPMSSEERSVQRRPWYMYDD